LLHIRPSRPIGNYPSGFRIIYGFCYSLQHQFQWARVFQRRNSEVQSWRLPNDTVRKPILIQRLADSENIQ
jgi:hypothetical protein